MRGSIGSFAPASPGILARRAHRRPRPVPRGRRRRPSRNRRDAPGTVVVLHQPGRPWRHAPDDRVAPVQRRAGGAVFADGEPLQPHVRCGTRVHLLWQGAAVPARPHRRDSLGRRRPGRPSGVARPPSHGGGRPPAVGDPGRMARRRPRRTAADTAFRRSPRADRAARPAPPSPPDRDGDPEGHAADRRPDVATPPGRGPGASAAAPPRAVHVDWRPYDSGVEPASFRRDWPPGAASISVDLKNISLRGDRVRVWFEPADGQDGPYAWFAADESGYGPTPPDVLLAEGTGLESRHFEYTHVPTFPDGGPANILTGEAPWPGVPGLEAEPEVGPSTLLAAYRDLAADAAMWADLRRLQDAPDEGIAEFARTPEFYLLYAREPDLRAMRRCGVARPPLVVEQLVLAPRRAGRPRRRPGAGRPLGRVGGRRDRSLAGCGRRRGELRRGCGRSGSSSDGRTSASPGPGMLVPSRTGRGPAAVGADARGDTGLLPRRALHHAIAQEGRLPAVRPEEFAPDRRAARDGAGRPRRPLVPAPAAGRRRAKPADRRPPPFRAGGSRSRPRRPAPGPGLGPPEARPVAGVRGRARAGRRHPPRAGRARAALRTAADWCRTMLEPGCCRPGPGSGCCRPDRTPGRCSPSGRRSGRSSRTAPAAPPRRRPFRRPSPGLEGVASEVGDADLHALAAALREHGAALGAWIPR